MIQIIIRKFNKLSIKQKIVAIALLILIPTVISSLAEKVKSRAPVEEAKAEAIYQLENNYMPGYFEEGYFDNAIFEHVNYLKNGKDHYIVKGIIKIEDPSDRYYQLTKQDQRFYFSTEVTQVDGFWNAPYGDVEHISPEGLREGEVDRYIAKVKNLN